jgi:hypothetical protein
MCPVTAADEPRAQSRWRSGLRVWLPIVVLVPILANFAVVLNEHSLAKPQSWPSPELQNKYAQITALSRSHDVRTVFFGDSMMDGGGDPALLTGQPGQAYNASLAGEPVDAIASWAAKVVVPRLHPTTVVLGFNINVLNSNLPGYATLATAFTGSRTVHVAEGGGNVIDHLDVWLDNHVPLYRYRAVLRSHLEPSPTASGNAIYDPPLSSLGWNEGFRARTYGTATNPETSREGQAELKSDLLFAYNPGKHQIQQLEHLIDTLKAEHIKVLLVGLPVTKDYTEATPGGTAGYDAHLFQLLSIGISLHIPVDNAGTWSNSYFDDPAHLNQAGSERFMKWLSSQLAGRGAVK